MGVASITPTGQPRSAATALQRVQFGREQRGIECLTLIKRSERFGFELAQPAHAFASHAAWDVTRRRPGVLAHRTRFVEIGPVTALSATAAATLLPFPDLRMGWGLDAAWSARAAERDWPIGVVDVTPVRHLRPVASSYPRDAAIAEAEAFLDGRAYVTRDEAAETIAEYRELPA